MTKLFELILKTNVDL